MNRFRILIVFSILYLLIHKLFIDP